MKKYLLALDLDGTLTSCGLSLEKEVIEYLHKSSLEGAVIGFITGRFFPFAQALVKDLPFPYYLAVQNGAELYSYPECKKLKSYYLSKDMLFEIDYRLKDLKEDFIVYTDELNGYKTYFRDSKFSSDLLHHILNLDSARFHPYEKLGDFSELPVRAFPCAKFLGSQLIAKSAHEILKPLPVAQTLIKDPTSSLYYMNLITHSSATKGHCVESLLALIADKIPVIAAGNDLNDVCLLKSATIGIAVGQNAPEALQKVAQLVAKSPGKGLIPSLETAKAIIGL